MVISLLYTYLTTAANPRSQEHHSSKKKIPEETKNSNNNSNKENPKRCATEAKEVFFSLLLKFVENDWNGKKSQK